MPATDKFFAINIRKYLALGDDQEAGEPAFVKLLSGFSCPKNPDLERFLKKSAKAGLFYPCIKTSNSKGRNSKQYCKEKVAAHQ